MILSHIFSHSMVQGIDLVGMILLVGGLTSRTLVVTPSSGQASSLERLLPFLLLLIGLGDLVLRSQMISGQPWEEIWSFLPAVLFKSHFGKFWAARFRCPNRSCCPVPNPAGRFRLAIRAFDPG